MKIRSAAFNRALNSELAERKRRINRIKQRREEEVYSAIPALKAVDEATRAIAYDLGRQLMGAPNVRELTAAAEAAVAEKRAEHCRLLVQNGYPEDYLDLEFICEECRDTGRIGGELCRCVTQLAVNTAFEDSGIDPAQCFDNFDLALQKSHKNRVAITKILDAAIMYANDFPNNERRDMLYFGRPGVGKTFLLNCIGVRVLERGYSVLKINAHKLIQLTLDNLRSAPEERPDFLLPDLLIIDDLGTEPMIPNITIETLLSIVCQRQDLGKATLFATNLDIVSDESTAITLQTAYGERFASRLMSPRNVKIQAVLTDNVRLTR